MWEFSFVFTDSFFFCRRNLLFFSHALLHSRGILNGALVACGNLRICEGCGPLYVIVTEGSSLVVIVIAFIQEGACICMCYAKLGLTCFNYSPSPETWSQIYLESGLLTSCFSSWKINMLPQTLSCSLLMSHDPLCAAQETPPRGDATSAAQLLLKGGREWDSSCNHSPALPPTCFPWWTPKVPIIHCSHHTQTGCSEKRVLSQGFWQVLKYFLPCNCNHISFMGTWECRKAERAEGWGVGQCSPGFIIHPCHSEIQHSRLDWPHEIWDKWSDGLWLYLLEFSQESKVCIYP